MKRVFKVFSFGLFIAISSMAAQASTLNVTEDCDTQEVKKQYSILAEYMKQKNYDLAAPAWRYVFTCAPNKYQGIYVWGNELMKNYIKTAKDETTKVKYVDSLMMLHNKRIELSAVDAKKFGSRGDNLGKKGLDMIAYQKDSVEAVHKIFVETVGLLKRNASVNVMIQYMLAAEKLRIAKKLECGDIVNLYAELSDYCEKNFTEKSDSNYLKGLVQIDKLAEKCLDCSALLDSYGKAFEQNKNNPEWLQKATSNLEKKECFKKAEFKSNPTLGKLFEAYAKLANTSDAYYKYAMFLISSDKISDAESYIQKAADLETEKDKKAKYYLLLATIQADGKQYSEARGNAKKALSLKENWGDPLILIGDMYAATACGEDACNRGGPLWAAADKYNQAKSVDPSCADKANGRIGRVAANYPSQADCFFLNIKDGTPHSVGCWINESTTVRTKKE